MQKTVPTYVRLATLGWPDSCKEALPLPIVEPKLIWLLRYFHR